MSDLSFFQHLVENYPKVWEKARYELLPFDLDGNIYSNWKEVYDNYLVYLRTQEEVHDNYSDSSLENMPDEIIYSIALQLNPTALTKLCQTSKRFREFCSDPFFWKKKAIQEWNLNPKVFEKSHISPRERYIKLYQLHQQLDQGHLTPELVGELYNYGDIKTVTEIPIEKYFPNIYVSRHVRSNIANSIEQNWIGHEHDSNIRMQYISLDRKDGVIRVNKNPFERTDLLSMQDSGTANNFIQPDQNGNPLVNTQTWSDVQMSSSKRSAYHAAGLRAVSENQDYWDHEVKFLNSKPWRELDGLTPRQAVIKLRELGW